MIRFKDIKINLRINLIYNAAFLLILGTMGLYLSYLTTTKIERETPKEMQEHVSDLKKMIEQEVSEKDKQLEIAINLASEVLQNQGVIHEIKTEIRINAVDQTTRESHPVTVNAWQVGNVTLQSDITIVDKIKELSSVNSTIFQKIDKGYLRISTNVKSPEGNRIIGTYIPSSSEVVKAIEQGQNFKGRSNVNGLWFRTISKPIYVNGEIKGILFVGSPENDLVSMRNSFLSKKYFDTGYPFFVEKDGNVVIHPTSEGENYAKEDFFIQMLAQDKPEGEVEYQWQGKTKKIYYSFSELTQSYICISIFTSEYMAILVHERNITVLAILFGLLVFVAINLLVGSSITKPLKQSVAFAESFAKGKLYATVDIEQKDEIGQMTDALRRMKTSLIKTVTQIKTSSLQIASISEQVSSAADQIAESANEQAASTEELSSSMEEMASNIAQTAENAQTTEKIAVNAVEKIEAVRVAVNKTLASMKLIADKITIIDEIAEKTDLLAVNAAIEAAKAGESGKGFAVVAHEVRKLAENSSGASREINKISADSVSTAENAGRLLENLIPEIMKTASLIQDISAAALEQDSGASQINNAIQQLTTTVQQNSAASEQLAAGAKQMAAEAEALKESVAFLQVEENDATSVSELFGMLDKYTEQINMIKERINSVQHSGYVHSQPKQMKEHDSVSNKFHFAKNEDIKKRNTANDAGFPFTMDSDGDFEKF